LFSATLLVNDFWGRASDYLAIISPPRGCLSYSHRVRSSWVMCVGHDALATVHICCNVCWICHMLPHKGSLYGVLLTPTHPSRILSLPIRSNSATSKIFVSKFGNVFLVILTIPLSICARKWIIRFRDCSPYCHCI
jgi:hypothetical protein